MQAQGVDARKSQQREKEAVARPTIGTPDEGVGEERQTKVDRLPNYLDSPTMHRRGVSMLLHRICMHQARCQCKCNAPQPDQPTDPRTQIRNSIINDSKGALLNSFLGWRWGPQQVKVETQRTEEADRSTAAALQVFLWEDVSRRLRSERDRDQHEGASPTRLSLAKRGRQCPQWTGYRQVRYRKP